MRKVTPKVFLIGQTEINWCELQNYLNHIGVPEWKTDTVSGLETIIEVMGRLCYKSFKPGLNPNVMKIRETSAEYLNNIIRVKHGSVLEHATFNFIFADVSRVFTHELVRHRVGVAISQESLRFVRLEDLGQWLPTVIMENEQAVVIFNSTFKHLEELQVKLTQLYRLDDTGVSFKKKKEITSAMRRIAPIGLATNIGWTANVRTLRWLIEMRTDPSAEEEMRLVFGTIAEMMIQRFPTLFGDFKPKVIDGYQQYYTDSSKI